jgi:phosphohistidine phosphatase
MAADGRRRPLKTAKAIFSPTTQLTTMNLILWRHAEAEIQRPGQDDMERELTAKGRRQARRVAEWLDARLPASARILVSPAARTQQTVEPLDRRFTTVAALAPGRGVGDLLQAAGWPDSSDTVLVVGHQPTLGIAAARLLCGSDQAWSFKKGAVWWLARREREGFVEVTLLAVQGPARI